MNLILTWHLSAKYFAKGFFFFFPCIIRLLLNASQVLSLLHRSWPSQGHQCLPVAKSNVLPAFNPAVTLLSEAHFSWLPCCRSIREVDNLMAHVSFCGIKTSASYCSLSCLKQHNKKSEDKQLSAGHESALGPM